ncbi:hypothetical protein GSI_05038 [Ganoderma sinense ZZ0214-1]|uniref:Uncharacterized protein n=1 Tax=Ganoderma sinense ZZ0214-1 TaxID=1077348 RepID=A0A2G8SGL2_9APHY|nr:hypothetical protein GSI_05038 [Ganoderma sinense ZZ0214-1]
MTSASSDCPSSGVSRNASAAGTSSTRLPGVVVSLCVCADGYGLSLVRKRSCSSRGAPSRTSRPAENAAQDDDPNGSTPLAHGFRQGAKSPACPAAAAAAHENQYSRPQSTSRDGGTTSTVRASSGGAPTTFENAHIRAISLRSDGGLPFRTPRAHGGFASEFPDAGFAIVPKGTVPSVPGCTGRGCTAASDRDVLLAARKQAVPGSEDCGERGTCDAGPLVGVAVWAECALAAKTGETGEIRDSASQTAAGWREIVSPDIPAPFRGGLMRLRGGPGRFGNRSFGAISLRSESRPFGVAREALRGGVDGRNGALRAWDAALGIALVQTVRTEPIPSLLHSRKARR